MKMNLNGVEIPDELAAEIKPLLDKLHNIAGTDCEDCMSALKAENGGEIPEGARIMALDSSKLPPGVAESLSKLLNVAKLINASNAIKDAAKKSSTSPVPLTELLATMKAEVEADPKLMKDEGYVKHCEERMMGVMGNMGLGEVLAAVDKVTAEPLKLKAKYRPLYEFKIVKIAEDGKKTRLFREYSIIPPGQHDAAQHEMVETMKSLAKKWRDEDHAKDNVLLKVAKVEGTTGTVKYHATMTELKHRVQ